MSNSEPSAIVVQCIACMRGLYKFSRIIQVSIRMQKTVRSRFAAIHPEPSLPFKDAPHARPLESRWVGRSPRDDEAIDETAGSEAGAHGPKGFEVGDNVAAVFGGECPK